MPKRVKPKKKTSKKNTTHSKKKTSKKNTTHSKKKTSKKKTIRSKKNNKKTLEINKVKLPTKKLKKISKKQERISIGSPKIDKLIQGGFLKNTTNLLVGASGSGKTILALQFLIEGMKKGEKCLYITFEEKKDQFYKNMLSFGWDLYKYEKKGLLNFLEYTPQKVRTTLEEGGGIIESIVIRKKVSRIVIDSITSFALLFKDEVEKRESSLQLFNLLSKWDCTSLLTFEGETSSAATRTLEFESDSIIILYFIRKNGKRQRYIEILKMRGTDHSKDIYKFDIGKGGIKIGSKASKDFV